MSLAGKKRRAKKAQKIQESASSKNDSTPTKSSKKRDKKLKNPDHVHESKGQSKALRYLKLWYANKKCKEDESVEPWKFEKCRQIWLLQNAYTSKVPPEDFKILVKYMATINGRMRDSAIGNVGLLFSSTYVNTVRCYKNTYRHILSALQFCLDYYF